MRTKAQAQGTALYRKFQTRLRTLKVLDPACGSGNFLYVVLKELKSLEKEAILWAAEELHVPIEIPQVGPEVVHGIELNHYAAELARVTVWIGELQWMISNGFGYARNPILRPLDTIECRDAILDFTSKGEPIRGAWPDAEFIVGNPPFLGESRCERISATSTWTIYGPPGTRTCRGRRIWSATGTRRPANSSPPAR
ncbi:DNA methyltransferase [Cystobacter fuscus]